MMSINKKLKLRTIALLICSFSLALADQKPNTFDYSDYSAILKEHIDANGMVSYSLLKADPNKLTAFVKNMADLDPKVLNNWTDKEKIAFYLNAYNALTLKVIIDNYPIKHSFARSLYFPKNSIRQIPGVWSKIKFDVAAKNLSLGQIEDDILRKDFNQPLIHMAMVCAAMSCPPLRNTPYIAEAIEKQLDEQAVRFFKNTNNFRIDRTKDTVYLSSILKWFAEDFVDKYSPEKNIANHNKNTSAVLNFMANYLNDKDKAYILKGNFEIEYIKYDWSLNEQNG